MEFSFESSGRGQAGSKNSSSSPANDRLRKAIERNRAKQAGRDSSGPATRAQAMPPTPGQRTAAVKPAAQAAGQPSLASRLRASSGSTTSQKSAQIKKRGWSLPSLGNNSSKDGAQMMASESGTRKTVARANDVEFTNDLVKSQRKAPAAVGYSTAKRKVKSRTRKNKESTLVGLLVKVCWIFCTFLFLRLIFSDGGVIDYYASKNLYEDKQFEYQMVVKDNKDIMTEIEKIKKNSGYQKKLVRDNLGYISQDEYLVLFSSDRRSISSR